MARKHKRRKSRRYVAAPKRRKRRMSGPQPQVVGARKRRRHKMHGPKRRTRKRMGAQGAGGGNMIAEYAGLVFGTGIGLFTAEIGGRAAVNAMGGGPGAIAGIAAVKLGASLGTFAVGKNMGNNSFVKGIGVGFAGSAANDGFRALHGAGIVSGTTVVVREIQDRGNNVRQLQPAANSQVNAVPVMGEMPYHDDWHYANVVND